MVITFKCPSFSFSFFFSLFKEGLGKNSEQREGSSKEVIDLLKAREKNKEKGF